MTMCHSCAKPLTAEEAHYYSDRCEDCERERLEQMSAAQQGEDEPAATRH